MDKPQPGAGVVEHHQGQFLVVKVHVQSSLSGIQLDCAPGHRTFPGAYQSRPYIPRERCYSKTAADTKAGGWGGARRIGKTAVVGRQLHINIRLTAPCGGQIGQRSFHLPFANLLFMA